MKEIWKDIDGYEGHYQVSSIGRVRSLDRTVDWNFNGSKHKRKLKGRILKKSDDGKGYHTVTLAKNAIHVNFSVHFLVLSTFISRRVGGYQCNHIDGNPKNNNVNNLEWVTPKENTIHAWEMGLCTAQRGENHVNSKLSKDDVLKIRQLYSSGSRSASEIARIYDIYPNHVSRIINRKRWSHI